MKNIIYETSIVNNINDKERGNMRQSERDMIKEKLKGLEVLEDKLVNNSNDLMELIKEKRRIIVDNTEEKQHRYKLEK